MKCLQVKKNLVRLLAGECTPCEETKITRHLRNCPKCFQEMEEFKEINRLLDECKPLQAPSGLLENIMASVESMALKPVRISDFQPDTGSRQSDLKRSVPPGLLRDLVAAAAVALVSLWLGTGWLAPLANSTEGRVSGVIMNYLHYTGLAMNRAQDSMTAINNSLSYKINEFSIPTNLKQGSD